MADPVRIRRIAEEIRGELSTILRDEVRDPRIGLLTVTRVKLAPDLGSATVFVSPLGENPGGEEAARLATALRSVAGFCRRSLSRRVSLRHTPELRFVVDDSIARGAETLELIRSLEGEPAREPAPSEEGPD